MKASPPPKTRAAIQTMNSRGLGGARGAMLWALAAFAQETGIVQLEIED